MPTKSPKNHVLPITVFCLTALFLLYEMALQVSPSVMTGQLMSDFQVSALGLSLLTSCYYYPYALMQIPAGLLFDRLPTKRLILIAIAICMVGTLLFSLTANIYTAALARIFIGFGSAFAFVACLVIAAQWFEMRYFALLVGVAQLLAALGAMGGQVPLSWGVDAIGWRPMMWVLAGVGALLALAVSVTLRKPPYKKAHVITTEPLLKSLKAVVSNPDLRWLALYACLIWAPMTAFASLWGVPYLKVAYGVESQTAAGLCSLLWLGVGLGSPLFGYWSDRLGKRNWPLTVSPLLGLASLGILLYLPPENLWVLGFCLFMMGVASSGQALSFASVQEHAQVKHHGTAAGFNNMAVVCSGAIFQPLLGWIMTLNQTESAAYTFDDYHRAFAWLLVVYVLAAWISHRAIQETNAQPVRR